MMVEIRPLVAFETQPLMVVRVDGVANGSDSVRAPKASVRVSRNVVHSVEECQPEVCGGGGRELLVTRQRANSSGMARAWCR